MNKGNSKDIDWEEAQRRFDAGEELNDIAASLGVHRNTAMNHIEGARLDPDPNWSTAQALRDANWEIYEIANYIKTTQEAVLAHTHPPKPRRRYELEWNANIPYLKGEEHGERINPGKRYTGALADVGNG